MDKIPLEVQGEEFPIRFRDCFSVRYLQSAAVLCRLGFEIEQKYRKAETVPADQELRHEAFILHAILSAVAFLESAVSELYADAVDEAYIFADNRNEALLRLIGERWKNAKNFDRAPVLTRYQKILEIAGRPVFSENDQAFANVRTLVEIRNCLMHYKRGWVVVRDSRAPEQRESATNTFENALRKKFATNPLAARHAPFFPDKCLGHGCAEWAILNSIIFVDEFFRRLSLPVPYEGIRDELGTR